MITYLLMVTIICLMFGVGLRTPFAQVVDATKQLPLMLRGLLANFIVVPLLFYLAVTFLPIRQDVAIGLLIMAAAPVAPLAPPFVGLAKGDVPYAVGLMTIVALLCVPLTPLILSLCLPESETGLQLDTLQILQSLFTAQLIPIGLGMGLNHVSRKWTASALRVVVPIGQIGLVISVVAIVVAQGHLIIAIGLLPNIAIVLLLIVCWLIGDAMMLGESTARRRSLGISTAMRNVALALLIVNSNYAGTTAVAVVFVFGILSILIAFIYSRRVTASTMR